MAGEAFKKRLNADRQALSKKIQRMAGKILEAENVETLAVVEEWLWDAIVKLRATTGDFLETNEAVEDELLEEMEIVAETAIIDGRAKIAELKKVNEARRESSKNKNDASSNIAKLPQIQLPSFDGKIENWQSFLQLFEALVGKEEYPKVLKMKYLVTALEGEALTLIKPLRIAEENYETAIKMLKKRYENKRIILNTHIAQLFNLPRAGQDAKSLKALLDLERGTLQAIQNLGVTKEELLDAMMVYVICEKLDSRTRREFENGAKFKLENVEEFIEGQIRVCEAIGARGTPYPSAAEKRNREFKKVDRTVAVLTKAKCAYCGGEHRIYACQKFAKLEFEERARATRLARLCLRCLGGGHIARECRSETMCHICGKNHHTLLHRASVTQTSRGEDTGPQRDSTGPGPSSGQQTGPNGAGGSGQSNGGSGQSNGGGERVCAATAKNRVVISTAVVQISDTSGRLYRANALLDTCAQLNMITEDLCSRAGLRVRRCGTPYHGVGAVGQYTDRVAEAQIHDLSGEFLMRVRFAVVRNITEDFDGMRIKRNAPEWEYLRGKKLADNGFDKPKHIDALFSAEVVAELILSGVKKGPPGYPTLVQTKVGWTLLGSCPLRANYAPRCCLTLEQNLERFWQLEELPSGAVITPDASVCEEQFRETHLRETNGRFVVGLPLRDEVNLGESRTMAVRRFMALERKGIPEAYRTFMSEYERLGHMAERPTETEAKNFLPHHAVYKNEKIRVVFDASAKTSNGASLNDKLRVGAVLQPDIFEILVRFRTFRYVLCTDIVQMYRQVLVKAEHQAYQCIVWRSNSNEELKEYVLKTVTYGTSSASFLATRCLFELAEQHQRQYGQAAEAIRKNSYMDDVCVGADTENGLVTLRSQLEEMLSIGGFMLSKWKSNVPYVLPAPSEESANKRFNVESKALGLEWEPNSDELRWRLDFSVELGTYECITKRVVLSKLAKIYDPMGLLAPVIVVGKMLMQNLWRMSIGWDEPLNDEDSVKYSTYLKSLQDINVRVERFVGYSNDCIFELVGFADASEKAYAACVYLRVHSAEGFTVNLLCAKTKVAPLKLLTVPRLELCAAELLARLMSKLTDIFPADVSRVKLFTDSQIVLAWLRKPAYHWATFVANRVARIQELFPTSSWHHVGTNENPADIASRGATPDELRVSELWWHGPKFLVEREYVNIDVDTISENHAEVEKERKACSSENCKGREPSAASGSSRVLVNVRREENSVLSLLERQSSYERFIRIVAYVGRFARKCRSRCRGSDVRILTPEGAIQAASKERVTVAEARQALIDISRAIQSVHFSSEVRTLAKGEPLSVKNRMSSLKPFMHTDGLLRVGGRLSNADLNTEEKHPILLPSKSHFSELIVRYYHTVTLHAGPQLTSNILRRKFWLFPNGRSVIRSIIRRCVKCARFRSAENTQIMGDLPRDRVRMSPPFSIVGVDYAGPFLTARMGGRSKTPEKAYIAVFVCFATRAVHLELVVGLTTEAFLAAFRRFTSRRGTPARIYSDNGTNFVGAEKEIKRLYELQRRHEGEISDFFSSQEIEWKFIPPGTPHMGGIWESAVKSTKFHLKRTIGERCLRFDELYTLLCQIEACMNSRPLIPLSEDATDLNVLTPGHFLIGRPLLAVPSVESRLPANLQSSEVKLRWKLLQDMVVSLWKRWKLEYLNSLQQRTRWKQARANLRNGDVVVIREPSPPATWKIGRVSRIFPDLKGVVRLVELQTSRGLVQKHVRCLVPLLLEDASTEKKDY